MVNNRVLINNKIKIFFHLIVPAKSSSDKVRSHILYIYQNKHQTLTGKSFPGSVIQKYISDNNY